jgi:hypothetical protein
MMISSSLLGSNFTFDLARLLAGMDAFGRNAGSALATPPAWEIT